MESLTGVICRGGSYAVKTFSGRNSLAIYVAFSFPMVATRIVGSKLGVFENVDLFALAVTASAVIGALMMAWLTRMTPVAFLFDRPDWAKLEQDSANSAATRVQLART